MLQLVLEAGVSLCEGRLGKSWGAACAGDAGESYRGWPAPRTLGKVLGCGLYRGRSGKLQGLACSVDARESPGGRPV